jgi:NhaP-type Na+/H+ or K+/H+ antiporter
MGFEPIRLPIKSRMLYLISFQRITSIYIFIQHKLVAMTGVRAALLALPVRLFPASTHANREYLGNERVGCLTEAFILLAVVTHVVGLIIDWNFPLVIRNHSVPLPGLEPGCSG